MHSPLHVQFVYYLQKCYFPFFFEGAPTQLPAEPMLAEESVHYTKSVEYKQKNIQGQEDLFPTKPLPTLEYICLLLQMLHNQQH